MGRKNHRNNLEKPWEADRIRFGIGSSTAHATLPFIHSLLGFIGLTNCFLYLYRQQNGLLCFPPNKCNKDHKDLFVTRVQCSVLAQCDLQLKISSLVISTMQVLEKILCKSCPVSLNQKATALKCHEGLWVILLTSKIDLALNDGRI